MKKILVTGGSGFIGTNLVEKLCENTEYEILNIEIAKPKVPNHLRFWKNVDLLNLDALSEVISDFRPDSVIHLGARTDLNGKTIEDYSANMMGVKNLITVLCQTGSVKQAVFASSMYVCEPGYHPHNFEDYKPHTLYGMSKVETERLIKQANLPFVWSIIRPTSIWGPWFGEPYDKFFHIVLRRMYFHMGARACKKTYGYIENAIYQIMSIFNADANKVNMQVYYIGDYEPYPISEWANEIASIEHIRIPKVPYICFKLLGWLGDGLKKIGIIFPMTSFRLHNMTTDNVHDLGPIQEIAPNLPVNRIDGTKKTLEWIHKYEL
jgi:nucleoside-diphosphate-sugar epimerase